MKDNHNTIDNDEGLLKSDQQNKPLQNRSLQNIRDLDVNLIQMEIKKTPFLAYSSDKTEIINNIATLKENDSQLELEPNAIVQILENRVYPTVDELLLLGGEDNIALALKKLNNGNITGLIDKITSPHQAKYEYFFRLMLCYEASKDYNKMLAAFLEISETSDQSCDYIRLKAITQMANRCYSTGSYGIALNQYLQAYSIYDRRPDIQHNDKLDVSLGITDCCYKLEQYSADEILLGYIQAQSLDNGKDRDKTARIIRGIVECHIHSHMLSAATTICRENALFLDKKNDSLKSELFVAIGDGYNKNDSPKEALESYEEALAISEEQNKYEIYTRIGNCQCRIGEYEKGLKAFNRAINSLPQGHSGLKQINSLALCYTSLFMEKGKATDYNDAVTYYNKALALMPYDKAENKTKLFYSLGDLHYNAHMYKEALASYNKGLSIASVTDNSLIKCISLRKTHCLYKLKEYKASIDSANKLAEGNIQLDIIDKAFLSSIVGNCYKETGRADEAVLLFK